MPEFRHRHLTYSLHVLRNALDAADAVVGNLGPLPAALEAMLFREGPAGDEVALICIQLAASCPKLGLVMELGPEADPVRAPLPDEHVLGLALAIKDLSLTLEASGMNITSVHLESADVLTTKA